MYHRDIATGCGFIKVSGEVVIHQGKLWLSEVCMRNVAFQLTYRNGTVVVVAVMPYPVWSSDEVTGAFREQLLEPTQQFLSREPTNQATGAATFVIAYPVIIHIIASSVSEGLKCRKCSLQHQFTNLNPVCAVAVVVISWTDDMWWKNVRLFGCCRRLHTLRRSRGAFNNFPWPSGGSSPPAECQVTICSSSAQGLASLSTDWWLFLGVRKTMNDSRIPDSSITLIHCSSSYLSTWHTGYRDKGPWNRGTNPLGN